jgi:integrase
VALCLEALAYSFAEDFVEILVPFSVDGVEGLVARLLNGGGLRLMEALRLRVKDLDGEKRLVTVRSGKGDKDRNTLLPHSLLEPLQHKLRPVRQILQRDLAAGWGRVKLARAWRGQSRMPAGGRRHLDPTQVQKAERRAVRAAGITKPAGGHSFRHSKWLRHAALMRGKAPHLLERGQTIRTIQVLLGQSDVRTMMIDTHVLNRRPQGVASPADLL